MLHLSEKAHGNDMSHEEYMGVCEWCHVRQGRHTSMPHGLGRMCRVVLCGLGRVCKGSGAGQ